MPTRAIVVSIALLAVSVVALARSSASASMPAVDDVRRSGVVSGLRLDMDGTVYVRLNDGSAKADKTGGVWFHTPPDRSTAIQVEELVLALLGDVEAGESVTLVAESDSGRDGSSPKRAHPLRHISRP